MHRSIDEEPMRLLANLIRILFTMGATTCWFSTLMADDAKILARGLRRRDPQMLDRLIEQYQYRLFRYLLYLTASRETAEDLFQETWMRVLDRGHQYDGKSSFEIWLFAIARHLVVDWQRQKKPQSLDGLIDPEDAKKPLDIEDMDRPSALEVITNHEEQGYIQKCLTRLPTVYREVLLLRFQEELALGEIAAIVAAPLSTVKSRLYRGLEA
ncbi:MAG TPA: RNA polymerase sigma factor, partial [Terriglobia bacterium]|nr:RNA polymerase sigma factor [Terriglobia bacterium]